MRLVKGGGVYVNNRRVADERARFTAEQAIAGRVFVVRKGARQYHLVRIGRRSRRSRLSAKRLARVPLSL